MRSRKNHVLRQCFAINFGSNITCSALSCCIIPESEKQSHQYIYELKSAILTIPAPNGAPIAAIVKQWF